MGCWAFASTGRSIAFAIRFVTSCERIAVPRVQSLGCTNLEDGKRDAAGKNEPPDEPGFRPHGAHLHQLFENSLEGVLLTAPDGLVLQANPAACAMLGRSEEEICRLGRGGLVDLTDPRLPILLAERARSGRATGQLRMFRADGTTFEAEMRSAVFRDDNGELRTSLSIQDITRRVQAEQELADAEELFRQTFDNAPIGMAIVALDGHFTKVNRRLCEIVGYAPEELVRLRFHDITHGDDLAADLAKVDALLRSAIPRYNMTKRYVRKDGQVVEVLLDVALLRTREHAPRGFIAQIQDLTERRKLEAQLAVSERLASIGTLAGGIAHEINSPLAWMSLNVEELFKSLEGPSLHTASERAEVLTTLRAGVERIQRVVGGIRKLARAERSTRVPLDLASVVESALDLAANEVRHRARIRRDFAAAPMVLGEESSLVQVFVSLFMNAAHAIKEGEAHRNELCIHIGTGDAGDAFVEVRDTGHGMAPETLVRIFDPFFTTRPVGVGSGLGLSISHATVSALGGRIEVTSEVSKGTSVRVTLPGAAPAAILEPQPPSSAASTADGKELTVDNEVLIVDDEPSLCRALERMLRGQFRVTVTTSSRDAVAMVREGRRFAAILSDVMMPEVSGADLYGAIASIDAAQASRIVFMSGGAFTAAASAFLESVDNIKVQKPFSPKTIRAVLQTVCARPR